MAEIGDVLSEFKSAKPPEKVLIIGAVILVGGIAFFVYQKNKSSSSTSATGGGTSQDTSGGNNSAFPSISSGNSQYPLLPNNVNPIYDSSGNLVGYQQNPSSTPTSTQPVTPPPPTMPNGIFQDNNKVATPQPSTKPTGIFTDKQGWFASTPGGTNNKGKNLGNLSAGTQYTLLSNSPTKFKNVDYYKISVNGQTGYVRGATIGKGGGAQYASNPRNLQMISRQQQQTTKAYAARNR